MFVTPVTVYNAIGQRISLLQGIGDKSMHAAKHPARWLAALAATQLLLCAPAVHAQAAGEVEFSRGVGFAQSPGGGPRTLGKGLELKEGDRLTTAEGASAVIKLQDGTRMTVRPNTEIVLQQY